MYTWGLGPDKRRLLELLLEDMTRHGVHVMIVLPPFHPAALQTWLNDPRSAWAFKEFRVTVRELVDGNPSLTLCDVTDPSLIPCAESEFEDSHHMNKDCSKRIVNYCFRSYPEWKDLL